MSCRELSYFDIVPEWQASSHATVRSQGGTDVSESPDRASITEITDESDADSGNENVTQENLSILATRRQVVKNKPITQMEMNKLENQLNRTTILCASLFCINIAISGAMFLSFMRKQ